MREELLYLVWLTVATGFSPSSRRILENHTAKECYFLDEEELLKIGFTSKSAKKLSDKSLDSAEKILRICDAREIIPIPFYHPLYPKKLLRNSGSPVLLYAKGDMRALDKGVRIGFVGTRHMSARGERFATNLASELIDKGAVLVTGGADGIDSIALKCAVRRGVPSVAVLGCDIDKYYPAKNYSLFELVARLGLVISEYPPGTNARYFPMRNRIIASLSDRVVVAEAPSESGALITADYASDYSVPIFAPFFSGDSFEGCRRLVDRGAVRLETADEVIAHFTPTPLEKEKKVNKGLVQETNSPETERIKEYADAGLNHVISCISSGKDTPEKMVSAEFAISDVLCLISQLELEGAITALPGDRYILNK